MDKGKLSGKFSEGQLKRDEDCMRVTMLELKAEVMTVSFRSSAKDLGRVAVLNELTNVLSNFRGNVAADLPGFKENPRGLVSQREAVTEITKRIPKLGTITLSVFEGPYETEPQYRVKKCVVI